MAQRNLATPLGDYALSYTLSGPVQGAPVLFLHGWGADKMLMQKAFSAHCPDWRALYLDLPGFGGSGNHQALNTADYAAIVRAFLKDLGFAPQAIIGHSFGGKVGTLLDPPILALLSTAGVPKRKSLRVRFKILLAKILRPLKLGWLAKGLRTQDAANLPEHMYQTLKNVVDEDFSAYFAARTKPTLIFWGASDTATPLASGQKLSGLIPHGVFRVFKGDHFFFLRYGREITEEIDRQLT